MNVKTQESKKTQEIKKLIKITGIYNERLCKKNHKSSIKWFR